MRHALGLPLPDATLETWARHFCFELEPLFIDATLTAKLEPHALVMTRDEFGGWSRSQPLEYNDVYQPWSVKADFVTLLTPAEFALLEPSLRLELNAEQIRSKRGMIFPLELARGFGVQQQFLERDVSGDSFLLRRDTWDALPKSAQFDWLEWHVTQDGHDCLSPTLLENPSLGRALELVGWLPHSGANCFATALSYGDHNLARARTIAGLWLQATTLERTLTARGLVERPLTAPLEPGEVIVWRNSSGALVHACVSLGDGLVLNKNAQGWHAPRQILALETVLESWAEDDLEVTVFAPGSR